MTAIERIFAWIEGTAISQWVTGESMFAFPLILVFHTVGMGLLAGTSAAIDLRILGFAKGVPLPVLERFYPVIWTGFVLNLASGVMLLIGYPYKAFTNPVFYVKLSFITFAIVLVLRIRNEVLRPFPATVTAAGGIATAGMSRARMLAIASLLCWVGAIGAGRLLAYTYVWLRVGVRGGF